MGKRCPSKRALFYFTGTWYFLLVILFYMYRFLLFGYILITSPIPHGNDLCVWPCQPSCVSATVYTTHTYISNGPPHSSCSKRCQLHWNGRLSLSQRVIYGDTGCWGGPQICDCRNEAIKREEMKQSREVGGRKQTLCFRQICPGSAYHPGD